jgi:hypothetical protein
MVGAMASGLGRPSPTYYIAIVVLVASLAIGSILFFLLVSRPAEETLRFDVANAAAEDCPAGTGAPVCYRFDVTNAGEARGTALCTTGAPAGTEALFENDQPTVVIPLEAGQTQGLLVKVTPIDTTTVGQPTVSCAPA